MKNQKGFVVQGVIAIVALVLIATGAYWISNNKTVTQTEDHVLVEGDRVATSTKCRPGSKCN